MYLLGYDIGSSSIKAALVDPVSREALAVGQSPDSEMTIRAPQPGWAEQDPEAWWDHLCRATQKLLDHTGVEPEDIKGIGIAYQMHGLVVVDQDQRVLRPSIIWCDSRAVPLGEQALESIGRETCFSCLLNSPGNFTASKLKWVKDHEPDLYDRIHKIMLPGDYIAMRLTGEVRTTVSGLSEGILWDFREQGPARKVLDHFGFSGELLPDISPTFSPQGSLNRAAAEATGLAAGIPVTYRAGDQPNNAMALNVLEPGEIAATGGTSGVIYGIVDQPLFDPESRVNGFAHVNYDREHPNIGILLCINGAGIQYSWIKQQMAPPDMSYPEMEQLAAQVPIGSDDLRILPFGNGAERMLGNLDPGARINNLQFNRHGKAQLFRAALEGVAFSFVYGMHILREMGLEAEVIRVGNDNLFQSAIFSETISSLTGSRIEVLETTGAVGAAKAAGVAVGIYSSVRDAMSGNRRVRTYEPAAQNAPYRKAYQKWERDLFQAIHKTQTSKQ